MVITQKYNSLNDIDAEFIPELEELLAESVPNFGLLRNYEQSSDEDTTFNYYLFFGANTNAPIGFAQVELHNKDKIKKGLFRRLIKKDAIDEYKKTAQWKIPGHLGEGLVLRPIYLKEGSQSANKLFNELQGREDIISQDIKYPQSLEQMIPSDILQASEQESFAVADTLVKNQESYQEFLKALPESLGKQIKQNWRGIQRSFNFKMGDYVKFKESFAYKANGASQYKELKKNQNIVKYQNNDHPSFYLTFESQDEVKALIIYTLGQRGHAFYEIVFQHEEIPEMMLHQLAIVKFYDLAQSQKLHCLNSSFHQEHLLDIGFTRRSQSSIKVKK